IRVDLALGVGVVKRPLDGDRRTTAASLPVGMAIQPGRDVRGIEFRQAELAGELAKALQVFAVPVVRPRRVGLLREVEKQVTDRSGGWITERGRGRSRTPFAHDAIVRTPGGVFVVFAAHELDLVFTELNVPPAVEAAVEGLRTFL